jgi:biopolymer transport protein ExbB/TolQ
MLGYSLIDLHIHGVTIFTIPLLLMLATNIGIALFLLFARIQKKQVKTKWLEAIKQIGSLAVGWGTLSTTVGLFQAFDAIERTKEMWPIQIIMGGLKVALITVNYGLFIFCISLLSYILFKLTAKDLSK